MGMPSPVHTMSIGHQTDTDCFEPHLHGDL